jgi:hypothetical protein
MFSGKKQMELVGSTAITIKNSAPLTILFALMIKVLHSCECHMSIFHQKRILGIHQN